MSLVKQTTTGSNYLEKINTGADVGMVTGIKLYEPQLGSDGASGNTIYTLSSGSFNPGTNTLMVYINGQKAYLKATPTDETEYEETSSTVITFGASLQDTDELEFIANGAYLGGAASSMNEMSDGPGSYGTAGQALVTNATADGWEWDTITSGGSGSGVNEITLKPSDLKFDETETGLDAGTVFEMIDTVNFDPDDVGSAWCSFKFPDNWVSTSDVTVDINYSLNGSDDSKIVKFLTKFWVVEEGDTPIEASPDEENSDDLASSTSNTGVYYSETISSLSAATISAATETVICKITRDADDAGDTYTGTMQLISVKFGQ